MKKMKKLHLLLAALLFTLLIPVCKPTTIQAATLKAPKTLTVKQGKNNISVQWSKVLGAKGYVVYRKTSPSQGWKRLKVVKAPTLKYLDKSISSGKSYYYTVRPYTSKSGKNTYGTYNKSGKNVVYLKEPKVTATKSHKSVTLKWNKTTGASGYEVYRKSGSSGYSKLDTTTALSYTDKNVEPSTKYTYAVRAYKKSGKTTFRSLYYDDQNLVDVKTNKEPEVTPEPEVDINDAVESKVYVNDAGRGIIEVNNKTPNTYYDVRYEIVFYDNNHFIIWKNPRGFINYFLNSYMTNYDEFRIPENFSYSYYEIKFTDGKKHPTFNDTLLNYVQIGDLFTSNETVLLPLKNTSTEVLDISFKFVEFNRDMPTRIYDYFSYSLNVNEAKNVLTPFSALENTLNNRNFKVIAQYAYKLQ